MKSCTIKGPGMQDKVAVPSKGKGMSKSKVTGKGGAIKSPATKVKGLK